LNVAPAAVANPAHLPREFYGWCQTLPGWADFVNEVSVLAQVASTPGWEDDDTHKTQPGAKPIGLAQWGSAIAVAAIATHGADAVALPKPGIDPAGFVWLTWSGAGGELALELHANLLHQSYTWTIVRDGMPMPHESRELRDVIEAVRSVATKVGGN
jgi:hypothetical protein